MEYMYPSDTEYLFYNYKYYVKSMWITVENLEP